MIISVVYHQVHCLQEDCHSRWSVTGRNILTATHGRRKEMFYLTMHSTHFIYGYMASYIWLRTILIVRKKTRCCHIGYSFRLTARVLLYAPCHRQDSTYHSLCYTSRGALAGTRNSSMGSPHEGSIRRPIARWANALTTELHLALPLMVEVIEKYDCDRMHSWMLFSVKEYFAPTLLCVDKNVSIIP